jgi:hypothetical protein
MSVREQAIAHQQASAILSNAAWQMLRMVNQDWQRRESARYAIQFQKAAAGASAEARFWLSILNDLEEMHRTRGQVEAAAKRVKP